MRTRTVPVAKYDDTVRRYAARGLHITAQGETWTTLQRPDKPRRRHGVSRAVALTTVTGGLYPFAAAGSAFRTDRITIRKQVDPAV